MRLWTIHPKYLDAKGLVALWREALLAKKVLEGRTKGYRHHPQLIRFRETPDPPAYIAEYLRGVYNESLARGYKFNADKLPVGKRVRGKIKETQGQLTFEWAHFMKKLKIRQPALYRKLKAISTPDHHPIFKIEPGPAKEPAFRKPTGHTVRT